MTKDRGERGFCLQEVLARLDDQQIDAAIQQSTRLDGISVAQVLEGDVAECWELAARAHRAGYPAWLVFCRVIGSYTFRELRREHVHVVSFVSDAVLGEVHWCAVE